MLLINNIFLQGQTSPAIFFTALIAVGVFVLIIAIVSNVDDSKQKKEFNDWKKKEISSEILTIPDDFELTIKQFNKVPICPKCKSSLQQLWDIGKSTLVIRCVSCKKREMLRLKVFMSNLIYT